jgi:NAD(P)-dependent dehydrogenase (short-subunit alcohol dehydrogenase family)
LNRQLTVGRTYETESAGLRREANQPNKRFATVEELGALTLFLASEAAASITGVALPMDGGWTAH